MKSCGPSSPSPDLATVRILPPLPQSFYSASAEEVAFRLLGKGLFVHGLLVEITETESYGGAEDPASHAFRGPTPRNRAMFEQGGICYVYLSYGINYCMNVVTGPAGSGQAVLLRAARPVHGLDTLRRNRGLPATCKDTDLLSGPGKLTKALGVDLSYNGVQFDRDDFKLVDLGFELSSEAVTRSPRIGISKAREMLHRFTVAGSVWLSRKR